MMTAVEYLFDKLVNTEPTRMECFQYLKEAKEMEKNQIITAHESSAIELGKPYIALDCAVEYYKENYE
jgi:hypothetical protein